MDRIEVGAATRGDEGRDEVEARVRVAVGDLLMRAVVREREAPRGDAAAYKPRAQPCSDPWRASAIFRSAEKESYPAETNGLERGCLANSPVWANSSSPYAFCRDRSLLLGVEGYALTSLEVALATPPRPDDVVPQMPAAPPAAAAVAA